MPVRRAISKSFLSLSRSSIFPPSSFLWLKFFKGFIHRNGRTKIQIWNLKLRAKSFLFFAHINTSWQRPAEANSDPHDEANRRTEMKGFFAWSVCVVILARNLGFLQFPESCCSRSTRTMAGRSSKKVETVEPNTVDTAIESMSCFLCSLTHSVFSSMMSMMIGIDMDVLKSFQKIGKVPFFLKQAASRSR